MELIVAWLDPSPDADSVVQWACRRARERAAVLQVITVVSAPLVFEPTGAVALVTAGRDQFLDRAAAWQDSYLSQAHGDVLVDDQIERRVEFGSPAAVLGEAARSAQLLVLPGSRRGRAVGRRCRRQLDCPIVLVDRDRPR